MSLVYKLFKRIACDASRCVIILILIIIIIIMTTMINHFNW